MGLFDDSRPLSYEETKKLADYVRKQGISQFATLYDRNKDRRDPVFKWGDEIEYMILKFDHENKRVMVSLRSYDLLPVLCEKEELGMSDLKSLWRPEYTSYVVEGTPGKPYLGGTLPHFNTVEHNMRARREELQKLLAPDERVISLTSFPRLGCEDSTYPATKPHPETSTNTSLFFSDDVIYRDLPMFTVVTSNVQMRKGEQVKVNLPVYKDVNTNVPQIPEVELSLPDHVYLDSVGFGMGCCCLQVTMQSYNLVEAYNLYDQLHALSPIFVALTAASPIQRGYLTDTDTRWTILNNVCDCRTRQERGLEPLRDNKFVINKSRNDTVDMYLSQRGQSCSDSKLVYDRPSYDFLKEHNVDESMAKFIAHVFIRDTLLQFERKPGTKSDNEYEHFDNIQYTCWPNLRLKPPPPNTDIGWRIEFRPCELQLTDFENAAFSCFLVLLSRVILSYNLNIIVPITKVDENIAKIQKRNALLTEKLWFRNDLTSSNDQNGDTLMSVDEIINGGKINGKKDKFCGLVPLVRRYVDTMEIDADSRVSIDKYLNFIGARASGKVLTAASWIRKFVTNHPSYQKDSVVTDEINYDLLMEIDKIQSGVKLCPDLLGCDPNTNTKEDVPSALKNLQ